MMTAGHVADAKKAATGLFADMPAPKPAKAKFTMKGGHTKERESIIAELLQEAEEEMSNGNYAEAAHLYSQAVAEKTVMYGTEMDYRSADTLRSYGSALYEMVMASNNMFGGNEIDDDDDDEEQDHSGESSESESKDVDEEQGNVQDEEDAEASIKADKAEEEDDGEQEEGDHQQEVLARTNAVDDAEDAFYSLDLARVLYERKLATEETTEDLKEELRENIADVKLMLGDLNAENMNSDLAVKEYEDAYELSSKADVRCLAMGSAASALDLEITLTGRPFLKDVNDFVSYAQSGNDSQESTAHDGKKTEDDEKKKDGDASKLVEKDNVPQQENEAEEKDKEAEQQEEKTYTPTAQQLGELLVSAAGTKPEALQEIRDKVVQLLNHQEQTLSADDACKLIEDLLRRSDGVVEYLNKAKAELAKCDGEDAPYEMSELEQRFVDIMNVRAALQKKHDIIKVQVSETSKGLLIDWAHAFTEDGESIKKSKAQPGIVHNLTSKVRSKRKAALSPPPASNPTTSGSQSSNTDGAGKRVKMMS